MRAPVLLTLATCACISWGQGILELKSGGDVLGIGCNSSANCSLNERILALEADNKYMKDEICEHLPKLSWCPSPSPPAAPPPTYLRTHTTKGYCADWQFLPGLSNNAPRLKAGEKDYDPDVAVECCNRCDTAYKSNACILDIQKGGSIRVDDEALCICGGKSGGTCSQITNNAGYRTYFVASGAAPPPAPSTPVPDYILVPQLVKGYCADWRYLPGVTQNLPRLESDDPLYHPDVAIECYHRCQVAYPGSSPASILDGSQGCFCSGKDGAKCTSISSSSTYTTYFKYDTDVCDVKPKVKARSSKGYCADWRYLPGVNTNMPRLESNHPLYDADIATECYKRCCAAYGTSSPASILDGSQKCICSGKNGATCTTLTSHSSYTTYVKDE